jgi:hypothetical protein
LVPIRSAPLLEPHISCHCFSIEASRVSFWWLQAAPQVPTFVHLLQGVTSLQEERFRAPSAVGVAVASSLHVTDRWPICTHYGRLTVDLLLSTESSTLKVLKCTSSPHGRLQTHAAYAGSSRHRGIAIQVDFSQKLQDAEQSVPSYAPFDWLTGSWLKSRSSCHI